MYKSKRVTVVFATYKEKGSIKKSINDFLANGIVDEVIVVNNNAEKGTDEEVKKTKAKLVYESKQGYGFAYQKGISYATGDYIILSEPDGSYLGKDIEKFLLYAQDNYDVILGSRTGQNTLLSGADMNVWRKFANVIEAKTIEIMFNSNTLSDVGCTYKLFKKSTLQKISKLWKQTGPLFSTELVLLTVSNDLRFIEIPINFVKRTGNSSLTGKWYRLMKWGVFIQFYIIIFWIRWTINKLK